MNGIILGPPGSGKGTLASWMAKRIGLQHISTGDLLRSPAMMESAMGQEWRAKIDAGKYIPDETMIDLIAPQLIHAEGDGGFILDGCPRTLAQAELLERRVGVRIRVVIILHLSDEVILQRLSGRRYHAASGRVYNIHDPDRRPRIEGLDDVTREPLQTRADDSPEVVMHRLKVFRETVVPVMEYYRACSRSSPRSAPTVIEFDPEKPTDIFEMILRA